MAKVKKTAFLILRVEEAFKARLMKKAGKNVSEFVRKALEQLL